MKGKFVTFEGGEGVGKTTQLAMIKKYLSEEGKDAVFLREPGGNAVSERIRAVILDRQNADMTGMCEALLYSDKTCARRGKNRGVRQIYRLHFCLSGSCERFRRG